ncbi:hypothetical protein ACO1L4_13710, partial [Staphylococcus aureus]
LLYAATLFACAHHFAPFFGPIVAKFLYVFAAMGTYFFFLHLYLIKDNYVNSSDCTTTTKLKSGNLHIQGGNDEDDDLDSNTKEEEDEG